MDTPSSSVYKSWPFVEAAKLCQRAQKRDRKTILLETGYGASGLPHIGTFAEVARTAMVQRALQVLAPDLTTTLICFCDDMDGLRKVPENLPRQDMLAAHLGKPLTAIPDPFGVHESFGAHNGARLRAFLDQFGFAYEYKSATAEYQSGRFDDTLLGVLAQYEAICKIVLPTLGPERRATYSPFLPLCPQTGKVLLAKVLEWDAAKGSLLYVHPDTNAQVETKVTGGACKLQWKVDWAMRWVAQGIDYEMAGKDLDESVRLSARICTRLGGTPPDGFIYELFLDEKGEKISKSRGNGLTIEDWLRYAPAESLSYYMFQNPRKARRLYFDVVPKTVDDYLGQFAAYAEQAEDAQHDNPLWHVHGGDVPSIDCPISFTLLLNLVAASDAAKPDVLWGFIRQQYPDLTPSGSPLLNRLVGHACAYYEDFVKPHKAYRKPDATARAALTALQNLLDDLPDTPSDIQNALYALGKTHYGATHLRDWFGMLYQVLLGQAQGPRFGSFIALYGRDKTKALIAEKLR